MKSLLLLYFLAWTALAGANPTNLVWETNLKPGETMGYGIYLIGLSPDERELIAYTQGSYLDQRGAKFVAFDATSGERAWEYGPEGVYELRDYCIGPDNVIYFVGNQIGFQSATLEAIRDGTNLWKYACAVTDHPPTLLADESLLIYGSDGFVRKIDSKTGTLMKQAPMQYWPSLTDFVCTADGLLVRRLADNTTAMDSQTLESIWSAPFDAGEFAAIGYRNELFVQSWDPLVYLVDPQTGRSSRSYPGNYALIGADGAMVTFNDHSVDAYKSGVLAWRHDVPEQTVDFLDDAILEDGSVLVTINGDPSTPYLLISLDGQTGNVNWQAPLGEAGGTFRWLVDHSGRIYIAGNTKVRCWAGTGTGLAHAPWPMPRQNAQRTGLSPGPVLRTDLQDIDAAAGSRTVLAADVAGESLQYQWYFNGVALAGATNKDLALDPVGTSHQGTYDVKVSGKGGTIYSRSANLSVQGTGSVEVKTLTALAFANPTSVASRADGMMFVANGAQIFQITPGGDSSVYAGGATVGFQDGAGTNAEFSTNLGLWVDPSGGRVLVADGGNHRVREILPYGDHLVRTLAGSGIAGLEDGPANSAKFNSPSYAVAVASGDVFICDRGNNCIRKLAREGEVSLFAGDGARGFKDGWKTSAQFASPAALALDGTSGFVVCDTGNHSIRKVNLVGDVTTWVGDGQAGFKEGVGAEARFNEPSSIIAGSNGSFVVADAGNNSIRSISKNGLVSTLAGGSASGNADGTGALALFNRPLSVAALPNGTITVVDAGNKLLRRVLFPESQPSPLVVFNLQPSITIWGNSGESFRIDVTEAPEMPDGWRPAAELKLSSDVTTWIDPIPSSNRKRFYRAVHVNQ